MAFVYIIYLFHSTTLLKITLLAFKTVMFNLLTIPLEQDAKQFRFYPP